MEKQYRNIRRIRLFFHRVMLRTRFFTSRRARSSSPSFPSGARKQSLEFWNLVTFLARDVSMGIRYGSHVWTAPAVQEESDVLRSVRVQPCIRPVFEWRSGLHCDAAAVAAGPDVIR